MTGKALALLVGLIPGSAQLLRAQGDARQCASLWSRPETLRTSTGAFVSIDRPLGVIQRAKEFLIFGPRITLVPARVDSVPLPNPDEFDARSLLGGAVASKGLTRMLQRPEFLKSASTIWSFPYGSKGIQVIWGVPQDPSKPNGVEVGSVWYARFDGRNWSEPELVMEAARIRWWHGTSSVALTKDQLVVAAPAVDSSWFGLLASRRTPAGWVTDRVNLRAGLPPSGVAAIISKGRALVFYPDVVSRSDPSRSAIYARELVGTSSQWSPERLVHPLSPGALNWPLAVETRDGNVHVFGVFAEAGANGVKLEHLWSTDLALWRVDEVPLYAHAFGLAVAPDGESAVQALLQTSLFEGLASVRWTRRGFSPIEQLPFAVAIGTGPNLVESANNKLLMTWTATATLEFRKTLVPFPVTLYSGRTVKCP